MFFAMTVYALMVPDTLGWGLVSLEASFGLLRFSFVTTSIFGAILVAKLFTLWDPHNVTEAWMEFSETKLLSFKKARAAAAPHVAAPHAAASHAAAPHAAASRAPLPCPPRTSPLTSHLSPLTSHFSPLTSHPSPLTSHLSPLSSAPPPLQALYLELMLQLVLYLFMVVSTVDWSGLLIVLAAFYLDAKNRNFMIMCVPPPPMPPPPVPPPPMPPLFPRSAADFPSPSSGTSSW